MNISGYFDNITVSNENVATSESFFQIWGVASVIISLVGIPGNILVILSVCLNKSLRTAPNLLVLNLSLCDMLFLILVVPCQACNLLKAQPCIPELCWILGFFTNWLLGSSVLNTVSIALNRYITIVLQSGQRAISNTKTVVAMCVVAYALPVILMSPILFDKKLGTFVFEKRDRLCGWNGDTVIQTVLIFVIVICPLIFMTVCYIRILTFVVASRKKIGAFGQRSTGLGAQRQTEARLSQMLAMVYLVYFITTFPSLAVNIVKGAGVFVSDSLTTSVFFLVWTSSAINPIVYGLVNKKYRQAYKSVLLKITVPLRTTEIEVTNTG